MAHYLKGLRESPSLTFPFFQGIGIYTIRRKEGYQSDSSSWEMRFPHLLSVGHSHLLAFAGTNTMIESLSKSEAGMDLKDQQTLDNSRFHNVSTPFRADKETFFVRITRKHVPERQIITDR